MRTNIVLDDELIGEALKLENVKSKKELIHRALKEFIEVRKRKSLLDLKGKINFIENYNYKALREDK